MLHYPGADGLPLYDAEIKPGKVGTNVTSGPIQLSGQGHKLEYRIPKFAELKKKFKIAKENVRSGRFTTVNGTATKKYLPEQFTITYNVAITGSEPEVIFLAFLLHCG
jgi:hypothetical protein